MTQEALAETLKISPQAVSRWELNLAMPDITLLPALANLFDVTADELLGIRTPRQQQRLHDTFVQAQRLRFRSPAMMPPVPPGLRRPSYYANA